MSEPNEVINTDKNNCRDFYEKNDKAKTTLFAMMIGLSVDGRQLGDTDIPPYKDAKLRKLFVPTTAHLKAEASRRAVLAGIETPSCKYWNTASLKNWLKENAVESAVDRLWLKQEEKKIFDLCSAAENEKQNKENKCKDWGDLRAWLRLHCCLYHDSVRPLLLSKDDVMDRQELDARNNQARPPTIYEGVAGLFNDPEVVFELPPQPDLHHLFSEPIMLRFEDMPGTIAADDAKRRIAEARARLLRTVAKWELSGNGFGQRTLDDEDYGHMEEEQLMDGDNRARFLDGIGNEHILVLWDLGDNQGVLSNVLNKLSSEVAVDCENIHTDTSEVQNPRRLTDQELDCKNFRDSLAASMKTMSWASLCQQLRESEDKIIKLNEQIWVATTEGAVEFYESCLEVEKSRNKELKEELKRVKRQRED